MARGHSANYKWSSISFPSVSSFARLETLCLQLKGSQMRVSERVLRREAQAWLPGARFWGPSAGRGQDRTELRAVVSKLSNFCLIIKKKIDPTSTNICIVYSHLNVIVHYVYNENVRDFKM